MKNYRGEIDLKKNSVKTKGEETVARYLKIGFGALVLITVLSIALAIFFSLRTINVASVGNEKIAVSEFEFFLHQIKENMLEIAGNPDPETFWKTKIEGEYTIDIAKKNAIESARELKVQVIKAKEQGISITREENENLINQIDTFIQQNGIGSSKTEKNKFLDEVYGVNLNELRDIMLQYRMREKLIQKELANINVDNSKIKEYYEKYPEDYMVSENRIDGEEAVWARHILIKVEEDTSDDEKNKARKKAEEIIERLNKGEDFAELAAEYSEDTGSKQYGGAYVFGRGKMVKEFEDAAFKLEPGEISGIVETTYGFHIIKLEEKYDKDEKVSLKCAEEYWEYGTAKVTELIYRERLNKWVSSYEFKINDSVYNSIR